MASSTDKKNIIAYVGVLPADAVESIRRHQKQHKRKLRIMLILDMRKKTTKELKAYPGADLLLKIDFSKSHKIAEALLPYQDELLAITCRGESNIGDFIDVIPHVPYLRTPTTESLRWATDKYEMRKRFKLFDAKNTPKFTLVKENSKKERKRIVDKIGFPMMIKPTNLAQSILVTICYHEEELEKALRNGYRKIHKIYGESGRGEAPNLMAEEYIEGDMYSIDAYVNGRGEIYCCPMVKVVTGQNIGHDDFYNYLRITPTGLKKESVADARAVVATGIHALGLRNTTTHVELIKVESGWKIVEIGPRVGGFRHKLHYLSCDIDHSLNDVLIRLPKTPVIPKKCKGYAATMRHYPSQEGVITQMTGIKKVQELKSVHDFVLKLKVGDRTRFSKNGGKGVFDVTLYNEDRAKLLADIRRIEKLVKIKVK